MIKITDVKKMFNKEDGITNISIEFEQGKIYGLVAPNGSGKSTLLKSIVGLYLIDRGNIMIKGVSNQNDLHKTVSFMPDSLEYAPNLTLRNIVNFLSKVYDDLDREKCYKYIRAFEINDEKKYSKLSKGQKMVFRFICTISRDVPIYIFDEPLSGMDPVHKRIVLEEVLVELNDEDKTIIISSHDLLEIENFIDTAVVLKNGLLEGIYDVGELKQKFNQSLNDWFLDKFKFDLNMDK